MGTRNLTMVIHNGETKIAQYGQLDGYPDGQGATCLNFLKEADLEVFKIKLNRCKFLTKRKETEIQNWLESIGCDNGWLNMKQAEQYNKRYPYLGSDHGAGILKEIYESTHRDNKGRTIWLQDSTSFAGDGLFCEWAYVIDLDKNTFEVYEGFGKTPLAEGERFKKFKNPESEYEPVSLVKSYDLGELPETVEDFVKEINTLTQKEEAD